MMKSTYGTGCFVLLNTGDDAGRLAQPAADHHRLSARAASAPTRWKARSSSPAPRCNGCATGSASSRTPTEAGALAAAADPAQAVYLVPAFVGLGAPYWDADARGAMFGLTRGTGAAEIARAALESVGYQTRDLLEAMRADWPHGAGRRRPCCASTAAWPRRDWTMQCLADILDAPVDRPVIMETTALGAAYLAGLARRALSAARRASPRTGGSSAPSAPRSQPKRRATMVAGWRDAVARTLSGRKRGSGAPERPLPS